MPKKKTTTKKKVIKVEKHKPFDLSVTDPKQATEITNALTSLQNDRGWLLLKQIFEGNIAVLEGAILKKLDPEDGKTPLTEDQCDRLRDRLAYLEELLNKPNSIIESFKPRVSTSPEYDPYDKVSSGNG